MATKRETPQSEIDERTGRYFRLLFDQPDTSPYTVTGLSIKNSVVDCLVTIKVISSEGPQVGFVGASNPATAVRKAYAQLRDGEVKMKPDEWTIQKFAESEEAW